MKKIRKTKEKPFVSNRDIQIEKAVKLSKKPVRVLNTLNKPKEEET